MKKTILITGSTDGIGKLAATKMAKEGHRIYLHGRNVDKLIALIGELKEVTKNEEIDGFVADFSDLNEVRKMIEEVNLKIPQLDILINNAGVFKSPMALTTDGYDTRMVVNFFAPYLLTNGLIPALNKSSQPRVINLSSAAQSSVSIDLLAGKIKVSAQEAYAQSKLAILMWSYYLSKQASKISVLALNPGSLLDTNMVKEAYGKFWSPASKGAEIIFDVALTFTADMIDGKYYDNDRGGFGPAHPDAGNQDLIECLIAATDNELR